MSSLSGALALLAVGLLWPGPVSAAQQGTAVLEREEITEIRLHGNHAVSDAEILGLAALGVGDRVTVEEVAAAEQRLRDSDRFELVRIDRRYRSLDPTDRVVLIITVREKTGIGGKFLFLPEILYNEDEGFSAGARASASDLLGAGEFISIPVVFGGLDRVALEITREWDSGVSIGATLEARRFENPHFDVDDERLRVSGSVRYRLLRGVRLLFIISHAGVEFGQIDDTLTTYGVSAALDTRPDVNFPYDAVFASAGWEGVKVKGQAVVNRFRFELAGYRTVLGKVVLAARLRADLADAPLPPYERLFVGGMVSLRGHKAGSFSGDNALLSTVELRVPLLTAGAIGRFGVVAFWDTATVWDDAGSRSSALVRNGVGAGLFAQAPLVRLNLDVASDTQGSTRVHFGFGFRF